MDTKNEKIEQLNHHTNITNISEAPGITIVNSEPVIESISIDQNGQVDPISIEYNQYREQLNHIYSTTTEENSMISEFTEENGKCKHILTIRQLNGNRTVALTKEFEYTDSFKNNFLIPMIEDYMKYNIIFDSNVTSSAEDLITFTSRTKENDTLMIKNIEMELASKLNDLIYSKNLQNPNLKDSKTLLGEVNNKGVGNYVVITLTALLIGLTLVGTIFFTIMSRK